MVSCAAVAALGTRFQLEPFQRATIGVDALLEIEKPTAQASVCEIATTLSISL
jgi:hypothetical protein